MKNEFLKLYNSFESHIDLGMSRDIYAFFDGNREVEKFEIFADDKENVIIHITLKDFSLQSSKKVFFRFIFIVGYIGINLFDSEYTDNSATYLFLTSTDGINGIKMKIVIE